ncbi:MAG: hypothetical protein ABR548_15475 [Actinomycetota bacterium]|nr:hypothetical protein [Actinomycetota bacterium]
MKRRAALAITIAAMSLSIAPSSNAVGYCYPQTGTRKTVNVAAFQFLGGSWVTVNPLTPGTAQKVPAPVTNGVPYSGLNNNDVTFVKVGDCIEWNSYDQAAGIVHSVVPDSGNPTSPSNWTEQSLDGASYDVLQITASFIPGTYKYHCGVHPGMVGEFRVIN